MRTLPQSPPLMMYGWCSTKRGRSDGAAGGNHCTAAPSAPAMDVKVPHSWTTNGGGGGGAPPAAVVRGAAMEARTTAEADRNLMGPPWRGSGAYRRTPPYGATYAVFTIV